MTTGKKIAYGVGGFSLGLCAAVVTAVGLHALLVSVFYSRLGFLIAYGYTLAIAIVAVALIWACLFLFLRNKALIRGVWYFMYTVIAAAAISLAVSLTP
jgi:hypothetical protein